LDVGCGGGLLTEALCRLGSKNIKGIDASIDNINIAKTHSLIDPLLNNINYQHILAEELLTTDNQKYDIVTSMEVIEHVDNPQLFVSVLLQLVKPGGMLFVSTLNRTFISNLLAVIAAEKILKWVPQGTHDWNKFVT